MATPNSPSYGSGAVRQAVSRFQEAAATNHSRPREAVPSRRSHHIERQHAAVLPSQPEKTKNNNNDSTKVATGTTPHRKRAATRDCGEHPSSLLSPPSSTTKTGADAKNSLLGSSYPPRAFPSSTSSGDSSASSSSPSSSSSSEHGKKRNAAAVITTTASNVVSQNKHTDNFVARKEGLAGILDLSLNANNSSNNGEHHQKKKKDVTTTTKGHNNLSPGYTSKDKKKDKKVIALMAKGMQEASMLGSNIATGASLNNNNDHHSVSTSVAYRLMHNNIGGDLATTSGSGIVGITGINGAATVGKRPPPRPMLSKNMKGQRLSKSMEELASLKRAEIKAMKQTKLVDGKRSKGKDKEATTASTEEKEKEQKKKKKVGSIWSGKFGRSRNKNRELLQRNNSQLGMIISEELKDKVGRTNVLEADNHKARPFSFPVSRVEELLQSCGLLLSDSMTPPCEDQPYFRLHQRNFVPLVWTKKKKRQLHEYSPPLTSPPSASSEAQPAGNNSDDTDVGNIVVDLAGEDDVFIRSHFSRMPKDVNFIEGPNQYELEEYIAHPSFSPASSPPFSPNNDAKTRATTTAATNELNATEGLQAKLKPIRTKGKYKVFAHSTSTYPRILQIRGARQGDPVCDYFAARSYDNGLIFCVCDGCGWGFAAAAAAKTACRRFMKTLNRFATGRISAALAGGVGGGVGGGANRHSCSYASSENEGEERRRRGTEGGREGRRGAVVFLEDESKKETMLGMDTDLLREMVELEEKYISSSTEKEGEEGLSIVDEERDEEGTSTPPANNTRRADRRRAANKKWKDFFENVFLPAMPTASLARSVGELAKVLLQTVATAHNDIIRGKDVYECGTTTLIAGITFDLTPPSEDDDPAKRDHHHQPPSSSSSVPKKGLLYVSIGDCKLFRFSVRNRSFHDLTKGNRGDLLNPSDCGGRIGPCSTSSPSAGEVDPSTMGPDLRNLRCHWYEDLEEGDLIWAVSDGIHDNLDPQTLGFLPNELRPNSSDANDEDGEKKEVRWEDLPQEECLEIKNRFMMDLLEQKLLSGTAAVTEGGGSFTPRKWSPRALPNAASTDTKKEEAESGESKEATRGEESSGEQQQHYGWVLEDEEEEGERREGNELLLTPKMVTQLLIGHALETTENMRDFMEQNPDKRQPVASKDYPGKLDHTTCLCFRID